MKREQKVPRAKIFSLFIVKFKKLGFSAPLKSGNGLEESS